MPAHRSLRTCAIAAPVRRAAILLGALAALVAASAALPGGGVGAAPAEASTVERMVRTARAELSRGVREIPDGSNRGGRIRMYGQSTKPRFYPAPWCAYFVSWVSRRAGRPLGPSGQGFGYVPYLRAWARRTGRWRKTPRSGDLIMFPQHVGMVERVYRNGRLTTIEGNSSNRVARRWRSWREASGYVRVATGGKLERRGRTPKPAPAPRKARPLVARISVYPSTTVAVGQKVGFSGNDSSGDIATYRWDLDGDGRYDDRRGDNAERTYRRAGVVTVGLQIRDRRGRTKTAKVRVNVRVNEAPKAKLVIQRTAVLGERVTAYAGESTDDDRIVRYEWDLHGDGRWEAGGAHRATTYRRPGVYAVGLRVYDADGAMSEAIATIEVTQTPPVARASAPTRTDVGRTVTFDASRSSDRDGGVTSWAWDFDGDGVVDAEGKKVTWRFDTPGTREGRLTVTDAWNAAASTRVRIDVVNAAPSAVIASPERIVAQEDALFDGRRSSDRDGHIVAYEWDFGADGTWDATGAQPRHRFPAGGYRRVRLRVTDAWGAQSHAETTVRVLTRPRAHLTLRTADPVAGGTTTFDPSLTVDPDGRIERLEWDLNSDGRLETTTWRTQDPVSAIYARAGEYTATLTAVDDDGLRASSVVRLVVR